MKYLHYTTALTGRDQAALLAIQWPLKPAFIFDSAYNYVRHYDFAQLEERVLGWMTDPASFIWDEASAIDQRVWDESRYIKSGRVRHLGVMSGRSMSFFAVNSGKDIHAAVLPNYAKSDPR